MPAAVDNAICGPQKPGTVRPSDKNINLAALNPCPLNACCNTWGQCGTTKEFCVDTTVYGAPGTAAKSTYGCISNCGIDIVNNDKAPAKFERITYFEAWNDSRPCLNMDVDEVTDLNTIIHFEFGWINEDFTISVQDAEEQFEKFVKANTKLKEVISYGGWACSNEHPASHIIRRAVQLENRLTFAANVVDFVKKHNLDGVDFDWEYPGVDDIGGSDPWAAEDGENYLEFLKLVKQGLMSGATASFTAPASYWHLRHFPIGDIAKVVGYVEGLRTRQFLRSHINKTQTENALSMMTKAGVPSYKVFVGISSYGRSFKMAKPECYDGALQVMLTEAMSGYDEAASGYDDVFDFYRDFMHDTLSERLRGMILDDTQPLAGFFNCYYTEGEIGNREDASKYDCKDPPNGYMQSYTFREIRDRDGLNKTLSKEGIDMERVQFDKYTWQFHC
ncbi:glycoside hydrolase superfamily [Dichotomopilus funicola]|uniref:chitinase n=1 Tax=Dichotomopilus funicola TaxID=1934379 RepID=A0AAN6V7B3_9PEZI|nr:glycoside hydrolase superfamily [Dichotomopilus funicola]